MKMGPREMNSKMVVVVVGPSFKERTTKPKTFARTAIKNELKNSKALPHKTRVLRQITPENSPESSAKSLSHKFFSFGVPFLPLILGLPTEFWLAL